MVKTHNGRAHIMESEWGQPLRAFVEMLSAERVAHPESPMLRTELGRRIGIIIDYDGNQPYIESRISAMVANASFEDGECRWLTVITHEGRRTVLCCTEQ